MTGYRVKPKPKVLGSRTQTATLREPCLNGGEAGKNRIAPEVKYENEDVDPPVWQKQGLAPKSTFRTR